MSTVDFDLKLFIHREVQCVDIQLADGKPRPDLELNNGDNLKLED